MQDYSLETCLYTSYDYTALALSWQNANDKASLPKHMVLINCLLNVSCDVAALKCTSFGQKFLSLECTFSFWLFIHLCSEDIWCLNIWPTLEIWSNKRLNKMPCEKQMNVWIYAKFNIQKQHRQWWLYVVLCKGTSRRKSLLPY